MKNQYRGLWGLVVWSDLTCKSTWVLTPVHLFYSHSCWGKYKWQSHVEREHYSVEHFNRITAFEHWGSIKGLPHTLCVNAWISYTSTQCIRALHAFNGSFHCLWTQNIIMGGAHTHCVYAWIPYTSTQCIWALPLMCYSASNTVMQSKCST